MEYTDILIDKEVAPPETTVLNPSDFQVTVEVSSPFQTGTNPIAENQALTPDTH